MTAQTFGPFVLDTGAAELRKGRHRIALRPKCFDLLSYLIDRRGKLVTKDELLERVWNDVVVDDATIGRTVAELRAALGDDRFIETVPKRGYKFVDVAKGLALIHGADEFPLHDGSHIIGRGNDVDIALYTPSTSRHHARIDVDGDAVVLTDLESRHGTRVNGKTITGSAPLTPGDQIEIGGERLILWSPGSETAPEPPSVHVPR